MTTVSSPGGRDATVSATSASHPPAASPPISPGPGVAKWGWEGGGVRGAAAPRPRGVRGGRQRPRGKVLLNYFR